MSLLMDNTEGVFYLLSNYWDFFLKGIASTIILSIVGTVGGLFLGIFLAFGENIHIKKHSPWYEKAWKGFLVGFCHVYSTLVRGTPMMVQAMIFKYSCQAMGVNWNAILPQIDVFNGWMIAGLIIITFNTAAYMGEIVKSGLNGVDKGQLEGARSLGLSRFQALSLVALPQAIRNSIPTIGNEWIVNIKDSSVLNVIGVSELYFMSGQAANKSYQYIAAYIILAIIYLLLTLGTNGILYVAERKMDGKKLGFNLSHFRPKKGA